MLPYDLAEVRAAHKSKYAILTFVNTVIIYASAASCQCRGEPPSECVCVSRVCEAPIRGLLCWMDVCHNPYLYVGTILILFAITHDK